MAEEVVLLVLELHEPVFQQECKDQTKQSIQKNFHQEDSQRPELTKVQPPTKLA